MKLSRHLIASFVFCLLLHQITAQTVPPALVDVLNNTLNSIRRILNVKPLSASIQFPDSSVWAREKGISSLNPTVNVNVDHAYLIGSVTKTKTTVTALGLPGTTYGLGLMKKSCICFQGFGHGGDLGYAT